MRKTTKSSQGRQLPAETAQLPTDPEKLREPGAPVSLGTAAAVNLDALAGVRPVQTFLTDIQSALSRSSSSLAIAETRCTAFQRLFSNGARLANGQGAWLHQIQTRGRDQVRRVLGFSALAFRTRRGCGSVSFRSSGVLTLAVEMLWQATRRACRLQWSLTRKTNACTHRQLGDWTAPPSRLHSQPGLVAPFHAAARSADALLSHSASVGGISSVELRGEDDTSSSNADSIVLTTRQRLLHRDVVAREGEGGKAQSATGQSSGFWVPIGTPAWSGFSAIHFGCITLRAVLPCYFALSSILEA